MNTVQIEMDALVQNIQADLDDTIAELVDSAQEHLQEVEINAPDDQQVIGEIREFLNVVNNPLHHDDVRAYAFEVFKAYGCCVFGVETDETSSQKVISDIDHRLPQLIWLKQYYLPAIDMAEINPNLHNNSQGLLLAQERLNRWIG